MHSGPMTGFTNELQDRLEEVHEQAEQSIDIIESSECCPGTEAVISDNTPYH